MKQQFEAGTCKKLQLVKFSEKGRRIGEHAPGAKLSDHEVELARTMYEEFPRGHPQHIGLRKLTAKFGVAKSTMADYLNYRKRVGHL